MVNKYSLWGVIVGGLVSIIVLIFLLWWMFFRVSYIVYSQDIVIEGDFIVTEDQPVMLKDNAKITVKGDAMLAGELVCKKGGVQLEVEGLLTMTNKVNCDTDPEEFGVNASGVQIVANGGLLLTPSSIITSEGSVQLVDRVDKIATSQEAIDELFHSVEEDTDQSGFQIGPLTNDLADSAFASPEEVETVSAASPLPFIATAYAAEAGTEPEGGAADVDFLVKRIATDPSLEEDEREALYLLLLGFGQSLIGRNDVSKNDARIRLVERFLENRNDSDLKEFIKELKITPHEAQEISELLDEYLNAEEKKLPIVISGRISVGDGGAPPEEIDVEELIEEKLPEDGETRKKPKKIILNFDFSDGRRGVALSNLTIKGPHGADAASGTAADCKAVGENGGDALRFTARAHNISVGNLVLQMGDGGDGGSIANAPLCDTANIKGGNGGKPGNIRMQATGSFKVFGELTIIPGIGGFGGYAKAHTESVAAACPGNDAGLAEAIGGQGGDSMQRLRIRGTIGGFGLIRVAGAYGGDGGSAFAQAGNGGDGNTCGCGGGLGGKAVATGGNGGSAAPAEDGSSIGGRGGEAIALGGDAGNGGHCKKDEGPAGGGGNGGDAIMTPGKGGTGDTAGADGGVKSEALAGDGGNGGDGCPAGVKGLKSTVGVGGFDGVNGKTMCSAPPPEETNLISLAGTDPNSMYEMEVIPHKGSGIPKFLVREAGPDKCKGDHWHGSGKIKMLNGEVVEDPATDGCGFGETSVVKAQFVPVNHEKMKELYGDSVEQYLKPIGGGSPVSSEVKLDGGIFGGESLGDVDTDEGGEMVQLCQVGFGSWVPCSEL